MAIDRVGTAQFSQSLLNEYTRIQLRAQQSQQQISTGKVGDQFADTKDKAGVLASAKIKFAAVDSYTATTKEALSRIDLQDLNFKELSDLSARVRGAIADALSTGHAPAFMDEIKTLFDETVQILNTKVDGKYIYGGSRTDQPPVNVTTLAALVAAPTTADVFDNTQIKQAQRVDDNETLEVGMTASDIGTGIMQMFKDIAAFDAGVDGPFGADLTAPQITFLSTTNAAVPAVQQGINNLAAINGARYQQAKATLDRHESMSIYFTKFIGDIEDADVAAAITRLNQDQAAAEAAARMIAQVNTMSLLNFMPIT